MRVAANRVATWFSGGELVARMARVRNPPGRVHEHVGELELDTGSAGTRRNGSSDGAILPPSATGAETRSTPRGWAARSRVAATLDRFGEKHSLVSSTSCCPTCVGRTDRVVRCNRAAPAVRSELVDALAHRGLRHAAWRAAVDGFASRHGGQRITRDQTRSLRKTSSPEATDTSLLLLQ